MPKPSYPHTSDSSTNDAYDDRSLVESDADTVGQSLMQFREYSDVRYDMP
jgi:hypothetical protein